VPTSETNLSILNSSGVSATVVPSNNMTTTGIYTSGTLYKASDGTGEIAEPSSLVESVGQLNCGSLVVKNIGAAVDSTDAIQKQQVESEITDLITNRISPLEDKTQNLTAIAGTSTFSGIVKSDNNETQTTQYAQQITTPSNPPAGTTKIYTKPDNKVYVLDSAGNETALEEAGTGATNLQQAYDGGSNILIATTNPLEVKADFVNTESLIEYKNNVNDVVVKIESDGNITTLGEVKTETISSETALNIKQPQLDINNGSQTGLYPLAVQTDNLTPRTVERSSTAGGPFEGFKAFDGTTAQWVCANSRYSGVGVYVGAESTNGILGEWISINLSQSVRVKTVNMRVGNTNGQPNLVYLFGSNDNINWTQIGLPHNFPLSTLGTTLSYDSNASIAYDWIRLVVNSTHSTGDLRCWIDELTFLEDYAIPSDVNIESGLLTIKQNTGTILDMNGGSTIIRNSIAETVLFIDQNNIQIEKPVQMASNRIQNLGNAIDPNDAINKSSVEAITDPLDTRLGAVEDKTDYILVQFPAPSTTWGIVNVDGFDNDVTGFYRFNIGGANKMIIDANNTDMINLNYNLRATNIMTVDGQTNLNLKGPAISINNGATPTDITVDTGQYLMNQNTNTIINMLGGVYNIKDSLSADVMTVGQANTTFYKPVLMSNNRIQNVSDPIDAQDCATKNYVDNKQKLAKITSNNASNNFAINTTFTKFSSRTEINMTENFAVNGLEGWNTVSNRELINNTGSTQYMQVSYFVRLDTDQKEEYVIDILDNFNSSLGLETRTRDKADDYYITGSGIIQVPNGTNFGLGIKMNAGTGNTTIFNYYISATVI
jgi:hypothetical protein